MRFKLLHYLALKALKLSKRLSTLALLESAHKAISLHETAIAEDRLKLIGKGLER